MGVVSERKPIHAGYEPLDNGRAAVPANLCLGRIRPG